MGSCLRLKFCSRQVEAYMSPHVSASVSPPVFPCAVTCVTCVLFVAAALSLYLSPLLFPYMSPHLFACLIGVKFAAAAALSPYARLSPHLFVCVIGVSLYLSPYITPHFSLVSLCDWHFFAVATLSPCPRICLRPCLPVRSALIIAYWL